MTARDIIDIILLPSEDGGLQPQTARAITPVLAFDLLSLAKDSVIFVNEEGKRNREDRGADTYYLRCVKMKVADKNECACNTPSGCCWYRTVEPLPNFIGTTPTNVTNTKGERGLSYTSWSDLELKMDSDVGSFTEGRSYTLRQYPEGIHLFLDAPIGHEGDVYIGVEAAFTNIMDMMKYDCDSGTRIPCDVLDVELNIPDEYRLDVIQRTIQLINLFFQANPVTDTMSDLMDGSRQFADT